MRPSSHLFTAAALIAILAAGCAGPRKTGVVAFPPAAPPSTTVAPTVTPPGWTGGAYHTLEKGQTLWRLSQIYGVSVDAIKAANKIIDPTDIPAGSRLWIPAAKLEMPDIPLYRDKGKWKYIVIHHTATTVGDKTSIGAYHRRRGFKSLGYHFLINNGSKGKRDGQIEFGRRWYRQSRGAHAKADGMNEKGIGIALVGNFSVSRVSDHQLETLAYLVRRLMNHYHIPKSHVLGHRDVSGARTACPGRHFPWSEFIRRL